MTKQKFHVGDVIRTDAGKTPWRIDSIGPGTNYYNQRAQVYRCTSLLSGRHEEYRLTNVWLTLWDAPLPGSEPKPAFLKGHTLRSEGAPHNANGVRVASLYGTKGTGRALCSCGETSEVLQSAGQRKRWHREHKDSIRAGQPA